MVDTVPRFDRVFTEDQLAVLAEGIPVTELPEMQPWPTNLTLYYSGTRTDSTIGGGTTTNSTNGTTSTAAPVIPPAPGP